MTLKVFQFETIYGHSKALSLQNLIRLSDPGSHCFVVDPLIVICEDSIKRKLARIRGDDPGFLLP